MRFLSTLLAFLILAIPLTVSGAMSSTQYYIYADSIGFNSNGAYTTSTDGVYTLTDTISESPAGVASSTSYEIRGGYQYMERGSLSISVSNSSVDLGGLNPALVRSASTVVTVNTSSDTGYTLSIGTVGGSAPSSVSDGAVTAGSSEYGVAVSGSDRLFSSDVSVSAGLNLASYSSSATDRQTTVTFKASMSNLTTVGTYTQTVTFSAAANL